MSGPFSSEELKYLISRGKLSRDDVVRHSETGQWVAASSLRELFPIVVARKPMIVTPDISPRPKSPVDSRPHPSTSARETIHDDASAEKPVPVPPCPPPTSKTREHASQQQTATWIGVGIGVAALLLMLLLFLLLYAGSRSVAQRWADNPGNQFGGGEGRAGSGAVVGPKSNEGATRGLPVDRNDGSESESDKEPTNNSSPQDVHDELSAEPADRASDIERVKAVSSDIDETTDAALEDMLEMEVEEDLPGFSIRRFEPPPPEVDPEHSVSRESSRQPNRHGVKTKWGEKPVAGCRAHFTGGLIADRQGGTFTQVYVEDSISEYVGAGKYPSNEEAFPKAIGATFDGIAIDKGTKVTIYREPKFQGGVVYEMSGPAIVNNRKWSGNQVWAEIIMGQWRPDLQETYPPKFRHWSQTDMHAWRHGSMIIECVR